MNTLTNFSFPSSQRVDQTLEVLPRRRHVVAVRDSDSNKVDRFTFEDVLVMRITYHKACRVDMVGAYDKLVEICDSDWLSEVKKTVEAASGEGADLRQFMLYLDDGPCYEFVCRGAVYTKFED
jgi:hypothetical protein